MHSKERCAIGCERVENKADGEATEPCRIYCCAALAFVEPFSWDVAESIPRRLGNARTP